MQKFLKKILSKKYNFSFSNINQYDVVIFDIEGSDEIKKFIVNESINSIIYDYNNFRIYINLKFLTKYFINTCRYWNRRKSLFHNLYILYILTEIQIINPKILITYNDDNFIYHTLIKFLNNIKFIAIQNGLREKFIRKRIKHNINHEDYYCFGKTDIEKQKSSKWLINNGMPVGSLRAGIALSKFKNDQKIFDIGYISEYASVKKHLIINKEWNNNIKNVDKIMSKFFHENKNLKLIVILRTDDAEERKYFHEIFGSNIIFSKPKEYLNSYKTIIQSKLVIGFASTLLIEALGLSTKALAIDTSNSDEYFDFNNNIGYKFKNNNDLKKRINDLINTSYDAYLENMKETIVDVMNLDKYSPPHLIIRNFINKELLSNTDV